MRIPVAVGLSIIVSVLILSGCTDSGAATAEVLPRPTSTVLPTGVSDASPEVQIPPSTSLPEDAQSLSAEVVVISGIVQPSKQIDLGFPMGGVVADVHVEPGDRVESGQLVAQLRDAELKQAVVQAEKTLELARARLAGAQAEVRPEEMTAAEAVVTAAEADLARARAERAAVEAAVEIARARLQQVTIESQVAEISPELAQARVEEAQAGVTRAEAELQAAQALMSEAQARLAQAQAERDLLQAGTKAEELAILAAEVDQAQAALDQAKLALNGTQLIAPFAGTVVAVDVQLGETVDRGEPAVLVADLDNLHIRTEDLDQLGAVRVKPGQEVHIWPMALPGQELSGRVASVSLRGVREGDVTAFPIIIELVDRAPDLRWGMTAIVEIMAEP